MKNNKKKTKNSAKKKRKEIIPVPPGETIKEQMKVFDISMQLFQKNMEMNDQEIQSLFDGTTKITPGIAQRLELIFDTPAQFWLNLEKTYQSDQKRRIRQQENLTFKERIQRFFTAGEYDIPDAVHDKYVRFYYIAVLVGVFFLIASIVAGSIKGCFLAIVMALCFIGYGYFPMLDVSKNGYEKISGTCKYVEYKKRIEGAKMADIPKRFIIEVNNEDTGDSDLYEILYFKQNLEIPQDAKVNIYYKKDAIIYQKRGINIINDMLGYEIV